jgi:hypothetical protein
VWPYWLAGNLAHYVPPICHAQFRDMWTSRATAKKKLALAFGMAQVDTSPTITSVTLKNTAAHGRGDLVSTSYTAASVPRAIAFREPFLLPLAVDGAVLARPDLTQTTVTIAWNLVPVELHASIYVRGADAALRHVRHTTAELSRTQTVGRNGVTLPLSALLPGIDLAGVTWEESPFRLVVAAKDPDDAGLDPTRAAWTYFHVPSDWDVRANEALEAQRVIMLGDDLAPISGFATVQQRTTERSAPLALTDGEATMVGKVAAALGARRFDLNADNVLVQRAGEVGWYAGTSWASVLLLVRHEGRYVARRLWHYGSGRRVLQLSRDSQAAVDDLRTRQAALEKSQGLLFGFSAKAEQIIKGVGPGILPEDKLRYAAALVTARQAVSDDGPTLGIVNEHERHAFIMDPDSPVGEVFPLIDELRKEVARRLAAVATDFSAAVLRVSARNAPGIRDFDKGRDAGPPARASADPWYEYEPGDLPIVTAITNGVSSCAGGVTFSTENPPNVIVLWHVDAPPSVPVQNALAVAYPDITACPGLRTIAVVHPSAWELNKYRAENIYPAEVRDTSQIVWLLRGTNLYSNTVAMVSGCDLFGLDLSNPDAPALTFSYDLDKRTEVVTQRINKVDPLELEVTRKDFADKVYGAYVNGVAPTDGATMLRYMQKMTANDPAVLDDKKTKCKVARLTNLGTGTFATVRGAATALTSANCWVVGEKAELEIGGRAALSRRWTPGTLG